MDAETLQKLFRPAFESTVALGMHQTGIDFGAMPFALDADGAYENEAILHMWNGFLIGLITGLESAGVITGLVPAADIAGQVAAMPDPNVKGWRVAEAINPHNSPPDDVAQLHGTWDVKPEGTDGR